MKGLLRPDSPKRRRKVGEDFGLGPPVVGG